MEKYCRTDLTSKKCENISEAIHSSDAMLHEGYKCAGVGESSIKNITEREEKIQQAEKKIRSLTIVIKHLNNELDNWTLYFDYLNSDKYELESAIRKETAELCIQELSYLFDKN